MNLTLLAALEVALLAGGAAASWRVVGRVGRGARGPVLLVAAATWLVLFGLVPFFAFALLVPAGTGSGHGAGAFETVVLNLVPWALLAGPALGVAQGLRATRRYSGSRSSTAADRKR